MSNQQDDVPDFERVAQLRHACGGRVEQVICLGRHSHRLRCSQYRIPAHRFTITYPCLYRRIFVGKVAQVEVSGAFAIEGETIGTLGRVGSHEVP